MPYQQAKKLLIEGKTEEALDLLSHQLEATHLHDEWALLRTRYQRMREGEMKGTLSVQEINIEYNRINDGLLRLIDQAAGSTRRVQAETSTPEKPAKKGMPAWLSWGLVLLLVVVSVLALRPMLRGDRAEPGSQPKVQPESNEKESRPAEEILPAEVQTEWEEKQAPVDGNYQRYYIGKVIGQRGLPCEIHRLGIGKRGLYLEMSLQNTSEKPLALGNVELLHTGDRKKASSTSLAGKVLQPGQKEKAYVRFNLKVEGEPKAFRLQLAYKPEGVNSARLLKTDFGVYQRID